MLIGIKEWATNSMCGQIFMFLQNNNQRKRRLFFWPYITLCKVITSSLYLCPMIMVSRFSVRSLLVMSPILILSVFTILVRASCQAARAPVWSWGKLWAPFLIVRNADSDRIENIHCFLIGRQIYSWQSYWATMLEAETLEMHPWWFLQFQGNKYLTIWVRSRIIGDIEVNIV